MTLNEELSTLRGLIKEITDDSKIPDPELYSIWKRAKGNVESKDPKKFKSEWSKHRFCMELESGINHDCSCVPEGCDVMVTKNKLPRPLSTRNGEYLEVTTLGRKLIGQTTEQDLFSNNLDEAKGNQLMYSIYNQRGYFYNTTTLKYAMFNGIWEDLTEWEDAKACGTVSDGSTTTNVDCTSIYDLELGVSQELSFNILQEAFKLIRIKLQIPDDVNANRNTEVKA